MQGVGALPVSLTASYAGSGVGGDSHYRHLWNLDGVAAVLHQSEIWVGNMNGASVDCARGFQIPSSWPAGTSAALSFSILANGTIGDLLINGVAAGPAAVNVNAANYGNPPACQPVTLHTTTPLYVGGSGHVGYADNWNGTVSAFSMT